MSKKDKKKDEQYPIEFPSRNGEVKHSPIVDVTENEIYPMQFVSPSANTHGQTGEFPSPESITEVVTTEIAPDRAEQTIHEQQKWEYI